MNKACSTSFLSPVKITFERKNGSPECCLVLWALTTPRFCLSRQDACKAQLLTLLRDSSLSCLQEWLKQFNETSCKVSYNCILNWCQLLLLFLGVCRSISLVFGSHVLTGGAMDFIVPHPLLIHSNVLGNWPNSRHLGLPWWLRQ